MASAGEPTLGARKQKGPGVKPRTYDVCGVPIAAETPSSAARVLVDHASRGIGLQVHLCNAYTLSLVDSDPILASALRVADFNLPDGSPVAFLGRRLGTTGPVRGPGLVRDTMRLGVGNGLRHYFFGGADGVAKAMADRLLEQAPGAEIAGIEAPPFRALGDDDLDQTAARVASADANIIWVGLGTPNQDYIVPRLAKRMNIVIVPVGAAFDFWAGNVRPAPTWLHGSGLEWAHRLATEPRRLWRRYVFGNPRFVYSAAIHRWGRK